MDEPKENKCSIIFKSNQCNEKKCIYYKKSKSMANDDHLLCVFETGCRCGNPDAQIAAIKSKLNEFGYRVEQNDIRA